MDSKVQPRVLAYTIAKEITEEELTEVSGGYKMCFHATNFPSGMSGMTDTSFDANLD